MIGSGGLLLVVSHVYAVPVLVWEIFLNTHPTPENKQPADVWFWERLQIYDSENFSDPKPNLVT
jgi:hypothetical protein